MLPSADSPGLADDADHRQNSANGGLDANLRLGLVLAESALTGSSGWNRLSRSRHVPSDLAFAPLSLGTCPAELDPALVGRIAKLKQAVAGVTR